MTPICKHCGRDKVNRPRGLCWTCYYEPGVKDLYPGTSKFAYRGVGHQTAPIPPQPTPAKGGTAEKVAVMAERVKAGFGLWHPADA